MADWTTPRQQAEIDQDIRAMTHARTYAGAEAVMRAMRGLGKFTPEAEAAWEATRARWEADPRWGNRAMTARMNVPTEEKP